MSDGGAAAVCVRCGEPYRVRRDPRALIVACGCGEWDYPIASFVVEPDEIEWEDA